jgi:FlaA1/EpsC-like NDP-sugar epimerase
LSNKIFDGKTILVTGGTGSLGRVLVKRILGGDMGVPEKILVFSRDEDKQHEMRLEYQRNPAATDEVIYKAREKLLGFIVGDVRSYESLAAAVNGVDLIIFASAMKQVPTCEYSPYEAILTNTLGAQNLVRALGETENSVELVIGISTDKACKPVNVYGMTKALQERILTSANLTAHRTKFICVRFGNVLGSRGSVIPLFLKQIEERTAITITSPNMTRFLLSLDQAVDAVFKAIRSCNQGEILVPRSPSAKIVDIANVLKGDLDLPTVVTGVRPGEKIHEVLISEEEAFRTSDAHDHFLIQPILPELRRRKTSPTIEHEYSSANELVDLPHLQRILSEAGFVKTGRSER